MKGLRSRDLDPGKVLHYLLIRTGMLREDQSTHRIQFVHRMFRDYLAAAAMVKRLSFGTLVAHAHEDSWHDVVRAWREFDSPKITLRRCFLMRILASGCLRCAGGKCLPS